MVEDGRMGTPDLLAIPPPLLSSAGRRSGAAYAQPSARSECQRSRSSSYAEFGRRQPRQSRLSVFNLTKGKNHYECLRKESRCIWWHVR